MPTGETTAVAPRICLKEGCGKALVGQQRMWCSKSHKNSTAARRAYQQMYNRTAAGRASYERRNARYAATVKGQLARIRGEAKRRSA